MPGISIAADRFDGNWQTKLTCPPKGNTEGYTWILPSVIQNSNFRGEHGTAGEKGYLLLEGQIKADGSAKLYCHFQEICAWSLCARRGGLQLRRQGAVQRY
jgi:hypothetical protein